MANLSCNTELRLGDLIGRGGMSEVYRAEWLGADGFEKPVAVKKILPETFDDPHALGLFQAEVQLCSRLQHPNIVQVFQCGTHQGAPFLVMEYLDGLNLKALSQKLATSTSLYGKKGLTVLMACHIVAEVAKGLGYAHRFRDPFSGEHLHVVHRDISPDNIFLTYSDGIKLVDFGIAKFAGRGNLTEVGGIRGKVRYLSPEQTQAAPLTAASDIFSLGIVFYEMLTGKHPFAERGTPLEETLRAIAKKDPTAPSLLNPEVPPVLDQIVLRALHKDPAQRTEGPGGARKLAAELDEFIRRHPDPFVPAYLFDFLEAYVPREAPLAAAKPAPARRNSDHETTLRVPAKPLSEGEDLFARLNRQGEAASKLPEAQWRTYVESELAPLGQELGFTISVREVRRQGPNPPGAPAWDLDWQLDLVPHGALWKKCDGRGEFYSLYLNLPRAEFSLTHSTVRQGLWNLGHEKSTSTSFHRSYLHLSYCDLGEKPPGYPDGLPEPGWLKAHVRSLLRDFEPNIESPT